MVEELTGSTVLNGSKYVIERKLGQGGFGITYVGIQTGLNRHVAIKEFFLKGFCERSANTSWMVVNTGYEAIVADCKRKFLKEAQTIATFDNPHVVKVIDVFEENNTAYYVMEMIEGESLADYVIHHGALGESEAIHWTNQIGEALQLLHREKYLHLDVKPQNVMLRKGGNAVLIDFGISKHYDNDGNQTTVLSTALYSPGYSPLEQYTPEGVDVFSPATDIYALGATLYFLLTATPPPKASTLLSRGLPTLPSSISQSTVDAIRKAMAPRRENRPESVSEFLGLLSGQQAVEKKGSHRNAIEKLIEEKEYRRAYALCMECLSRDTDVEYVLRTQAVITDLMKRETSRKSILGYIRFTGIIIVLILVFWVVAHLIHYFLGNVG